MKIKRFVSDLGNSISQFMIDGNYFEMPSSCVETTKEEAESVFAVGRIDQENLIHHLIIKIQVNDEDRYFIVGSMASKDVFADDHLKQLHDKTESIKTFANWMAAAAFYHAYHAPDLSDDEVEIQYSSTLLPVWLLKRAPKFKTMLEKMEQRFSGEIGLVELLTPGYERVLRIKSDFTECRIEGETARYALSRGLDLRELESAATFKDCIAIINDLGGQTHDLSKLKAGLKRPGGAEDFKSFTDKTFLQHLENLRVTKLMTHFRDLRSLEQFIKENISLRKFVYVSPITRQSTDFTEVINWSLSQYARIVVENAVNAFEISPGEKVKFVWIGGVAQLLKEYLAAYISSKFGEENLKDNHVFPEQARMLNIYSLEIIAKGRETASGVKTDDKETKGSVHL